jgi:uncharacterized membrane protein YkoI
MMKTVVAGMLLSAFALVLVASEMGTAAEKVEIDKLPKAVLDALNAKFSKAKLVSASSAKTSDGKLEYEVTLKYKKHSHDVSVSEAGKILVIEKEIDFKSLPKVVADAVTGKHPGAKIERTEEITKDEKISYEVLLQTTQNKKFEVYVDPQGKILEEKAVK